MVKPEKTEVFYMSSCSTPLGDYVLLSSAVGLACLCPAEDAPDWLRLYQGQGIEVHDGPDRPRAVKRQLAAYFHSGARNFTAPLDLRGTSFQQTVWRCLLTIPYGETRTYRQVAQAIGRPQSARPVGGAVGANPVSIIVPCHRVVGSNGTLTGYGGGLWRKEALLALERDKRQDNIRRPSNID